MKATTRLRQLLARPGLVMAPGVSDALMARLVSKHGFEAIYMTGAGTSAVRLGMPDVGLMTLGEMADNAEHIAGSRRILGRVQEPPRNRIFENVATPIGGAGKGAANALGIDEV